MGPLLNVTIPGCRQEVKHDTQSESESGTEDQSPFDLPLTNTQRANMTCCLLRGHKDLKAQCNSFLSITKHITATANYYTIRIRHDKCNNMNLTNAIAERPSSFLAILLSVIFVWIAPKILKHALLWHIPMAGNRGASVEERRKAYLSGARQVYTTGYRTVCRPSAFETRS